MDAGTPPWVGDDVAPPRVSEKVRTERAESAVFQKSLNRQPLQLFPDEEPRPVTQSSSSSTAVGRINFEFDFDAEFPKSRVSQKKKETTETPGLEVCSNEVIGQIQSRT